STIAALSASIAFLRRQGIPHLALMPSSLPLPVLAAFFHLHPRTEDYLQSLLGRWLWRGWVHGFGPGSGQTPILRRAVKAVNPRHLAPGEAPDAYTAVAGLLSQTSDEPAAQMVIDKFSTKSTPGRLALLALAHREPRDPSGEPIDLPVLLSQRGSSTIGQLTPGARGDIGTRGFWLAEWGHLTGNEDELLLNSHLVDAQAVSMLVAGDSLGFAHHRRRAVLDVATKLVNSRIASGRRVRPPLSELYVPDPGGEGLDAADPGDEP
ncbi:MAG: hypothetical protein QG597_2019, partial [Actinomycetota bacterium]|nr:hypothetical protein [Actinomycetota bacterium]